MIYSKIPNTDIEVSKICLGTMTFGQQNSEADAHEQLNFALSKGVNFIDTAELYAVPANAKTQGLTEKYIGTWLAKYQKRKDVVLATKIAGPSPNLKYIRPNLRFSKETLADALHKSLQRLQTDYIDLYQLHWPDRNANYFGQLGYTHNPDEVWEDHILEIIETLDGFVKAGKIRHYGLSNETPWGVMRHLQESSKHELTRARTIQNAYSLVNRTFEVGLAEISMREDVGLLAYSALAFGKLTGKYLKDPTLKAGRINLFPQMSRYNNPQTDLAIEQYAKIAQNHRLSLTQMALAFVHSRPFTTATIIGATQLVQLKENIESIDQVLSDEVLNDIEQVHKEISNPAP